MFLFMLPVFYFIKKLTRYKILLDYYRVAGLMGVCGFVFLMLLHPLSTEMSEWGLYLIMVSWLHSLSKGENKYGASKP